MILGLRWWIMIWYGILTIGVAGLVAAVYWGRQTHWRNLDEVLRAIGTITVSVGMLLFLYRVGGYPARALLVLALLAFVLAFVVGRRAGFRHYHDPGDDLADEGEDQADAGPAEPAEPKRPDRDEGGLE